MQTFFLKILQCSLTIGIILTCTGCARKAQNLQDTFYYNEPNGLATLDPAQTGIQASLWAGTQLFNGLVDFDSVLAIQPAVARSWSVDETGTIWTFILRGDIYFHEDKCFGEKKTRRVTARDFKYSFERICDARTKSTGLWLFREKIVGAAEYHKATGEGKASAGVEGFEAVNDTTFRLRLVKPFAPFLSMLTMPYAWIVPREAVEYYGQDFFKHPVGTGPFRMDHWTSDRELVLRKNPRYFRTDGEGKQLPYLNTIHISFLRDTKSEFLEFQKGKIDLIGSVDPSFAPAVFTPKGQLKGKYTQYRLLTAAAHTVEYYGIMLDTDTEAAKSAPLAKNRLLRQALNYAINRERIIRYILRGKGIPANHGILPPTMPGFHSQIEGYKYNPERARELLARAGYPQGKGLPKLTLHVSNNQRVASTAEAIQDQWRELGIDVGISQIDFPQHQKKARSGEFPLWRASWIGDYPDPENFLALFYSKYRSPGGPNTTRTNRKDLDSLYEKALSPLLPAHERFGLYNEMERIIIEESPWIFLYYNVIQRLTQPSVKGLSVDGSDRLILERVWKEPKK